MAGNNLEFAAFIGETVRKGAFARDRPNHAWEQDHDMNETVNWLENGETTSPPPSVQPLVRPAGAFGARQSQAKANSRKVYPRQST
jgi:hypothetical protein